MDSLKYKLKIEYKFNLDDILELYPATHEAITRILTDNTWVGNVRLSDAIMIVEFLTDNKVELYDIGLMFNK